VSENVTTVTLKCYHDGPSAGLLDCWVQEPNGPVTSFDPAQLPAKMTRVMGDTLTNALVRATKAEEKAKATEAVAADALAKVEAVAHLVAVQEQLDAKDAIIQDLMAQMAPVK
jgi:hypothetical protein